MQGQRVTDDVRPTEPTNNPINYDVEKVLLLLSQVLIKSVKEKSGILWNSGTN